MPKKAGEKQKMKTQNNTKTTENRTAKAREERKKELLLQIYSAISTLNRENLIHFLDYQRALQIMEELNLEESN